MRSHWTSPSGEYTNRIAPASAVVVDGGKTTNTTKTQLVASDYDTF
jgi:hypothetical protein